MTPPLFGASPTTGGTRFRLWAPALDEATLEVDGGASVTLARMHDGWFDTELAVGAGTRYRWRVRGADGNELAVPDPASRAQAGDVHGWSVVVDPGAYAWRHADWRGRAWAQTVLYELHPGLCGGFAGIEAKLPELLALGITAVELMPVADFPGTRNWGYDGVLPYAPDEAYGTPDDLRRLVDAAHALGLMVFLDVVHNHFGPDGNYIGVYAPGFFRDDVQTPWGAAIDFRRPEVRAFFTGNAIHWITEYRLDGLRFDAVHEISDPGWLDEMALAVRAAVPDRHVHLVLEHDGNAAAHLEGGPPRFDAQWNDDAHHVLHVLLTGEAEGYYRDYADEPARRLAHVLAEGYDYQGQPSAHRGGEPRGTPSAHLPPTAFVDCLQNHDQIGNRAFGDRLAALADPPALRAATALLLLSAHIPMLFMGEELGSRTPFMFFTDHHDELADAVREGRRAEFSGFASFNDPDRRAAIPDPNDAATYAQSLPEPGPDADAWQALVRKLLQLRHDRLVPRLDGAQSAGARVLAEQAVAARWRLADGSLWVVGCNLGAADVPWPEAPAAKHLVWPDGALGADRLPPQSTRVYHVPALGGELRQLATAAGIAVDWNDFAGRPQTVGARTLGRVLTALGHACETPEDALASLAALTAPGDAPAMVTGRVGESLQMPLPAGDPHAGLHGELTLESGAVRTLLLAVVTPPSAQGPALLSLGPVDEPGYHRLALRVGAEAHALTLAVAPRRAWQPPMSRAWGTAVQVYALRAESTRTLPDGGFGDFGALAAFARAAGEHGADAVAISPTHAGFAADPTQYSPYAPSSRLFHNVLLVDPAAACGAEAARAAAHAAGLDAELQALATAELIDWPRAGRAKLAWLRAIFDAEPRDLALPLEGSLKLHAVFEALHAHFSAQGQGWWRQWPAEYQDPASDAVARFAHEQAREVVFHAWLQSLADAGLGEAQAAAEAAGMRIGLVADLAVGMSAGGSHAWAQREDLLAGLEIGAPPDLLNTRGQMWGLTAFSPPALKRTGYAAFLATVRAALRQSGGVRIDHILGLNRLWLVPEGSSADAGAYLQYPLDDLVNLLVLESHRHQALVIGEDLGTVPDGFRDKMAAAGLLGMCVLWFEREGDGFRPLDRWPTTSVALTTTHDLATAAGWWVGRDIEWRTRVGSERDPDRARAEREHERHALAALVGRGTDAAGADIAIEAVGRSASPLALVPVEDLLDIVEQPNLPGTIDQHPNWRQRLPGPADRLFDASPARKRAARLAALRPQEPEGGTT